MNVSLSNSRIYCSVVQLSCPSRNSLILLFIDYRLVARRLRVKIVQGVDDRFVSHTILNDQIYNGRDYFISQCSLFGDLTWHSSMKFLNEIFYCRYSLSASRALRSTFSLSGHRIAFNGIYFMLNKLSRIKKNVGCL